MSGGAAASGEWCKRRTGELLLQAEVAAAEGRGYIHGVPVAGPCSSAAARQS